MKWWVFLFIIPSVFACFTPYDGMVVKTSLSLCPDVYYLDNGITITGNNVNMDCDGAVLKSWSGGKGISIEHASNITVTNCRLVSYDVGLYVRNATQVFLEDNHLVKNQVGTRFVVVSESATLNHDVSLSAPYEVFESENNVLSLTNKFVEGDFCSDNFCNKERNAIEVFVAPKLDEKQLHSWLMSVLEVKSPLKLFDWVFGSFQ